MPRYQQLDVPAKIGLVSDTHRSSRNPRALPGALIDGLSGCDLILHAGDINAPWVIEEMSKIAPVLAVTGNNDEPQLRSSLKPELFLRAGEHRIGLIHGHEGRSNAWSNAVEKIGFDVDILVYGHSHFPMMEEHNGILLINPGSPTQRRKAPSRSFAIMDIGDEVAVDFVEIESK